MPQALGGQIGSINREETAFLAVDVTEVPLDQFSQKVGANPVEWSVLSKK